MEADDNAGRAIQAWEKIEEQIEVLKLGGGTEKIELQHRKGMLTARERIDELFDPGTFVEVDQFAQCIGREFGVDKLYTPSDGVITGYGKVDGRTVAALAQDATVVGGAAGEMHMKKIVKITQLAADMRIPIVGLHESGGVRLQEFLAVSREYGHWFRITTRFSGVIPQIAAIMGSVAGGQSYEAALCDWVLMTKSSSSFIAGPPLVKSVLGEDVSIDELGGAVMHSSVSGVCHVVAEDDIDCIDKIKELLSYLPQNYSEKVPRIDTGDDPERLCERLYEIVPTDVTVPFEMHDVIYEIVDSHTEFFEIHKDYATSMIVGFARFDGYSTGIIANNPIYLSGSITCEAAEKASRFVRFCDAFNIPLLYLTSTPAYLVGSEQEQKGMIFRGATLLHATSEATVPIVDVVIGWAYAGAWIAMGSKYLGGDFVCAWPTAEVGAVAAPGVVDVVRRKEIKAAENPTEAREKYIQEFKDIYMHITYPAGHQHIDAIIDAKETRRVIIKAFDALKGKKQQLPPKKHGNSPY